MRYILIIIFTCFLIPGNGQGISKEVILDAIDGRNVDRHLKTLINMIHEVNELTTSNERFTFGMELLETRVNDQERQLNHQNGVILDYRDREISLVDSLNHYKMLEYGGRIRINDITTLVVYPLEDRVGSLETENKILTWVIGVLVGLAGGILIF